MDGSNIAGSLDYTVIEHAGHKIGLIGLAEFEWIATLSHFDVEDMVFENPITHGEALAQKLSICKVIIQRKIWAVISLSP